MLGDAYRRDFSQKATFAPPVELRTGDLRTKRRSVMNWLVEMLTIGLRAYFVYALIKPENF